MYSSAYVWAKILGHMENRLTAPVVSTWFDEVEVVELTDTRLVLYSSSDYRKDIILSRCAGYIQDAMQDLFQKNVELVVFGEEEMEAYRQRGTKKPKFIEFNPQFTFDRFVVGSSNRFAHAAALAVANNPAETYNPLFIYGPSGLGKTHLLYAIASVIHEKHPDYNIVYIKGDQFTNELIAALQEGRNAEFRSKYRGADLFLVDDIQFIAGKTSTQEEFFHTFNTLHGANKQIILSSDRPPKDMDILEDRIRSRFEWGLLADIQSPDYETRIAILRKKQELDGYSVSDDVIEYIASNIKSNIRELEGALNKIIAYANLEKREINIDLAEQVLRDIISPNEKKVITPEFIIDTVADHFDITPSDIVGSKRSSKIVFPRQIAMYLCREMLDAPLTGIGKMMGDRDHTTVMHGIEKIEKEMSAKDSVRNTVDILKKKINPSK